ncbi:hypothetical protein OKW50_002212 [Paraburkholderia youngii]
MTVPSQREPSRVSVSLPLAASVRSSGRSCSLPVAAASSVCFARVPDRRALSVARSTPPALTLRASVVNASAPFAPSRNSAWPCAWPTRLLANTTLSAL